MMSVNSARDLHWIQGRVMFVTVAVHGWPDRSLSNDERGSWLFLLSNALWVA